MIITIGGNLGAGKTTLANNLANELHYQQLYVGGIFRDMAAEKNLSIEQIYAQLKQDPVIEQAVDQRQAAMMREKDDLIVQAAWHGTLQRAVRLRFSISYSLSSPPRALRAQVRGRKMSVKRLTR